MATAPALEGSAYYFGYGSNMSTWRIHKNMSSAQYMATARLRNYSLRFVDYSENFKGAYSTICEEEEGKEVWGVVWRISQEDLESLDRQEGASFRRVQVTVETGAGVQFLCHVAQHSQPSQSQTQPSPQYLEIIRAGALEHHLPTSYLHQLNHVQHNGFSGNIYVP